MAIATRAERNDAWEAIIFHANKNLLTKTSLLAIRKAGKVLGLSSEDMEDIESAIGFRSQDLAVLYDRWASVRAYERMR